MRLIDADALMLRLAHYHAHSWGKVERAYGVTIVEIHNASTIDAEPVRHGRWVHFSRRDKNAVACSVCDYPFARLHPANYCPNCGAKMDGGAEE